MCTPPEIYAHARTQAEVDALSEAAIDAQIAEAQAESEPTQERSAS